MKSILAISILTLTACAVNPPATLSSWDGKNGKVRQGVFGPIHEPKVEPEMARIMAEKCPNGYEITKIGSDVIPAALGSAEAKTKEFTCK